MTSLSLNVGNFITIRPTSRNNYHLWREQALALIESQELVGLLTNEDPTPTKYTIPDPTDTTNAENFILKLINNFIAWRKSDRLLCGWIIKILSEDTLGLVVGLDTAHAVTYLRKEDDNTIGEHLRTFKGLCDSLATIGKIVLDKEKVFCLLTSLDPQYETFTTTKLKPPRPSYFELVSQLQNFDQ
ncbi:hypothetical protein Patl1_25658 [Pistacia atlantica]|uniref:Uncharacterized protein n=1 Tax=Pistacia atlantica TaxID=434234 RepID=A0ACC1B0F9_9ROSI|nr:hypothetical protein Patl1_25658 [Pistacia atlantica]